MTHMLLHAPLEEVLAKIWADVLGIERVGVNDDFFQLGGHSMLATQIISQVREALPDKCLSWHNLRLSYSGGHGPDHRAKSGCAGSDEDMEQMLTELENLSEDDVKLLLEMESTQREQS